VVRERYKILGLLDEFRSAFGDGTLWTVMVAALTPQSITALRILLPQAAALTKVLQCEDLLADTEVSQLSSLVQSVRIKDAEEHIIENAPIVARAMSCLTELLSARWDTLYRQQGSGRQLQPSGSILWNRSWGWKITTGQAYCPGYVNVDEVARSATEFHAAIKRLIESCTSSSEQSAVADEGLAASDRVIGVAASVHTTKEPADSTKPASHLTPAERVVDQNQPSPHPR
jgi:hypothetical protein